MRSKLKHFAIAIILLGAGTVVKAQESGDTVGDAINKMESDIAILKRIKFSGYVQPQYQQIDSSGAKTFAGGDFPAGVNKRFKVRRAEFKTMYDNGKTQIVANIDITQGGVNIKDAYGKFTEQKWMAFAVTAGIFNRPFGWEVNTSSGTLESPERSRFTQTLLPGERDLGAMLTFQLPVGSPLHPLKIDAGMFNGNANNSKEDYDFQKDFIGRITWTSSNSTETINYGIGASFYNGGNVNTNKFVYDDLETLSNGNFGWMVDSTSTNKGAVSKRQYIGGDGQFSILTPLGITTVRAEYVMGSQPGTSSDSKSPNGQTAPPTPADTYIRNMTGYYGYFLQGIGKTKNQIIVKYDFYDPNTGVSGTQIGKTGTKLTAADIQYTTLGFGWIYHWDSNVKFVLYYDMVTNEKTSLAGYTQDVKDNVFTARIQYRF